MQKLLKKEILDNRGCKQDTEIEKVDDFEMYIYQK